MESPSNTTRVVRQTLGARNTAPFALAVAGVGVLSFLSGGYILARSTPVVVALLVGAAVWVWFLRRRTRPSLVFGAALAAFAVFTAWTGLSVVWSYGPDLTWNAFNLTAFYLAVVAVLGLTSVRGLQLRTVAYGYLVVATAVAVYAFLGKGLPDVVTHAHTYARLDSPVGYWNVLAVMMVMGIVVVLAVGGDRSTPAWLRTLAAAGGVPMCLTFFFTFSRGGWLALGVALVLYFAFTTARLGGVVTLAAVAAPVGLVLWRLRGLGTLFTETTDDALRTLQGHTLLRWTVAALVVTAGVQLVAALLQTSVRWPRWSTVAAGAAVLAVAGLVVFGGGGLFVQRHGGAQWVRGKAHSLVTDQESSGNGAGRLLTVTSSGRIPVWREALSQSRYARVAGTGAGTFSFSHDRFRTSTGVVLHAHSQWFNVLSELGVVGLALFAVAIALLVVALVGNPFAGRDDPLRPLLVALQAGAIAFLVHMSWDWDWDMAAIGVLAFVFVAACVSYRTTRAGDRRRTEERARRESEDEARAAETAAEEVEAGEAGTAEVGLEPKARDAGRTRSREARQTRRRRPQNWGLRVVASAALVLLAVSWLPPYLSQRAENSALAAAGDGRVPAALDRVRSAARLDPLAVSPLLTQATLLQQLGQNRAALAVLRKAARLQPQDYEVWFSLGELQQGVLGQSRQARASFTRALALNPLDGASRSELNRLAP